MFCFCLSHRRYGVLGERFVWEGGTRAAPHQGVYALMHDAPHAIAHALDMATRGLLARVGDMSEYIGGKRLAIVSIVSTLSDGTEET